MQLHVQSQEKYVEILLKVVKKTTVKDIFSVNLSVISTFNNVVLNVIMSNFVAHETIVFDNRDPHLV